MSDTNANSAPNIEALRAKYEKIYKVTITLDVDDETTEEREYVFKKPTTSSYDRFVKTATNSPTKASRAFVLDNIVPEQLDTLTADIEEYPAMVVSLNEKLFNLLGLSKDTSIKKL